MQIKIVFVLFFVLFFRCWSNKFKTSLRWKGSTLWRRREEEEEEEEEQQQQQQQQQQKQEQREEWEKKNNNNKINTPLDAKKTPRGQHEE